MPLLTHDHSGTGARATNRLLGANTHQSPDTDSSTAALHHTIGTGAYQAASGSIQATLLTNLLGGVNRTKAPMAGIYLNATVTGVTAGDNLVYGSRMSVDFDTDSMAYVGTTANDPATITAPVAGRYLIELHLEASSTTNNCVARIVLNGTNANSITSRATTQSIFNANGLATGDGTHLHEAFTYALSANDRIQMFYYFATTEDLKTGLFGATRGTSFSIRYVGPTS